MRKRVTCASLLLTACFSVAFLTTRPATNVAGGKLYAGLGYAASQNEQTAGAGLALSIWGVAHGAISGAAYGAVFGGPVGAAVGVGIGL